MRVWRWEVLARLAIREGLTRGAEIGVADGRFTKGLLSAVPDMSLIAVDYWPEGYRTWDGMSWGKSQQDSHMRAFLGVLAEYPDRVTLIEKPSVEAAHDVRDGSLDFVFIDADHSYEGARADIQAWLPKVRSGGFITGHDYDSIKFPGVIQAVNEFFPRIKTQEDYVWLARKA